LLEQVGGSFILDHHVAVWQIGHVTIRNRLAILEARQAGDPDMIDSSDQR
jgi:hypothetical protein